MIRDHKETLVAMQFLGASFSTYRNYFLTEEMKDLLNNESQEAFWIKELGTVYPYGLNDRCNGQDWFNKNDDDIASTIFNKTKIVRKKRSNKKIHNFSKNWNYEEFLRKVKQLYDYIDDWIFFCRKTVSSLSIKTLKCFLLKLDELSWNLIGDYPRIILEVIQDLVKGRIYFVNFRKNTMQTKKNFLHSNFLKIYFHMVLN